MFNIHNIFKNCSRLSKDYSPNIKTTEKSIECLGKNKNTSLDFSSTPLKQNKKLKVDYKKGKYNRCLY